MQCPLCPATLRMREDGTVRCSREHRFRLEEDESGRRILIHTGWVDPEHAWMLRDPFPIPDDDTTHTLDQVPEWLVMFRLRLLLGMLSLAIVLYALVNAPWEATLRIDNYGWSRDLGRFPVWQAPAAPDYAEFRQSFEDSTRFPDPQERWTIRVAPAVGEIVGSIIGNWWLIAGVPCSMIYLSTRARRRDIVLEVALWICLLLLTLLVLGIVGLLFG